MELGEEDRDEEAEGGEAVNINTILEDEEEVMDFHITRIPQVLGKVKIHLTNG